MGDVSGKKIYTVALGTRICGMIAEGASLRRVASQLGIPRRTIQSWIKRYAKFRDAYTEACQMRLLVLEDKYLDLCDEASEAVNADEDPVRVRVRLESLKLQVDSLKFLLAKLLPQKYGDRTQMEITGRDGADLLPAHTREEDAAYLAMLAAVRVKTPPGNGIIHE